MTGPHGFLGSRKVRFLSRSLVDGRKQKQKQTRQFMKPKAIWQTACTMFLMANIYSVLNL